MKFLGQFKCPKCSWVHVGISETDAIEHINSVNPDFAALSYKEKLAYNGNGASLKSYLRCFRCRAPSADFVQANPGDSPTLATLQAVIVPTPTKA
jgi:hypothetical protein